MTDQRRYVQRKGILTQRVARVAAFPRVADAAASGALSGIASAEPVLMVGRLGRLFQLNISAAIVWESLREPSTISDVAATLSGSFAVPATRAVQSAEAFLVSLLENELIVACER